MWEVKKRKRKRYLSKSEVKYGSLSPGTDMRIILWASGEDGPCPREGIRGGGDPCQVGGKSGIL